MRRLLPLLVLLTPACSAPPRVDATPEEQVLIGRILRDPGVKLVELDRSPNENRLIVTTSQGRTTARYILAPEDDAPAGELRIRRLRDEVVLDTVAPEKPGIQVGR